MPILTPEERVGTVLAGKYRLDRIIATGGMATVFAGLHAWTERAVAVKILNYEHARDPEVVRRFLQEARAAAQLKHPNVVDVLDMGQDDDGTVFLVLELLEGETLKMYLRRGSLGVPEVSALLLPILRAVAAAHAKGVVHRDLKPDNIYLALGPNGETLPKLLDFGIAKVASGDSSSTRTGTMVGTPQFMAPEQVRGEREVGPAADVWSMGVLLHYGLSKQMPFNAESAAAVLARVLTERARPIRDVAPEVPLALAAVVDRALQHDPAQRFADMGQMLSALEAALAGALIAPRQFAEVATQAISLPPGTEMGTGLPSEYPPAPTTPFAWGAAAPQPEEPRARDARPFFAAGAAIIVLLGVTTFWLALGPLGPAPNQAVQTTQPLGPLTAPAVTAPAPATEPVPATEPAPVPAPVAVPATEPASVPATEPVPVPAPAIAPAPVTAPEPATVPVPATATPAAAVPAPATPGPSAASPARSGSSERGERRTRSERASAPEDDDEPEAATSERSGRSAREPQRGTGGALILDDRATPSGRATTREGPRRGTGGALILH